MHVSVAHHRGGTREAPVLLARERPPRSSRPSKARSSRCREVCADPEQGHSLRRRDQELRLIRTVGDAVAANGRPLGCARACCYHAACRAEPPTQLKPAAELKFLRSGRFMVDAGARKQDSEGERSQTPIPDERRRASEPPLDEPLETRSARHDQCHRPTQLENSNQAHKAREATRRRCQDEESSESEPEGECHRYPGENAPTSEEIGQLAWSRNAE